MAYVVPHDGARPDTAEMRDHVRASKGPVHAPKAFHLVDRLPMTALGKIDKVALRAPHWDGQTRRV